MAGTEGVIKFQMEYTVAPALPGAELRELNAWRKILFMTALIGQDPNRYGGYGFGNISCRIDSTWQAGEQAHFAITGTQTGGQAELTPDDYVLVTACYPEQNKLVAQGPVKPSSESLTHGVLYALDSKVRWVMHAHSPHIWRNAAALALPMTGPVPYGTPEMADEVARLYREGDAREKRIFGMAGHEDGVVSFGATAEEAGFVLLGYLARAFQL